MLQKPYMPSTSTCIRPRKIMCVSGFSTDNIQTWLTPMFLLVCEKNTKKITTLKPITRPKDIGIHFDVFLEVCTPLTDFPTAAIFSTFFA